MTCEPLANTGIDAPVLLILMVGAVCLMVGLWILLRARHSATNGAVTLLVILTVGGGVTIGLLPVTPALAAPPDCASPHRSAESETETESATEPGPGNSLTITQTSTMDDLAPGVPPAKITGLVVNNGPDSTFITAITVVIDSVTRQAGAAAGSCDATDYVLANVRMPVGQVLEPAGGSAVFAGATIGFNNKSSNQDACKGATVLLRYSTVPA